MGRVEGYIDRSENENEMEGVRVNWHIKSNKFNNDEITLDMTKIDSVMNVTTKLCELR